MKSKVNMGFLPKAVRAIELIERFEVAGLLHFSTGKTREMFEIPDKPELLLIYATDRISIFDIVLNALIKSKGHVLTASTIFWLNQFNFGAGDHLMAYGSGIDEFLPKDLRGDSDLQKRCLVVEKAMVLPIEAIVRGNLTGSGLNDYKATGMVCGHELPPGLHDGSKLPEVLFTPSTKAEAGEKDRNIEFDEMVEHIGGDFGLATKVREEAKKIFSLANEIANKKGIVIADTKFEFGMVTNKSNNTVKLALIDEILTPDSSRFWPFQDEYTSAPESFVKQGVREWGKSVGIKKNPTIVPPEEVLDIATKKYRDIIQRLSGMPLESFWQTEMKIDLAA